MRHIILLGDSIFDNRSYVNGGKDTIANLRDQMPDDWKATLLAIDGSVADSVSRQLPSVPNEATHLFVSVGGNDALGEMGILQMRTSAATEVFMELSNVVARFEGRYKRMLDSVLELNRPTAVCTIYYPQYPDERMQKVAVAALASFNDVIIRQAFLAGVPLIDLRYVCDEEEDYANPIEPSEAGGAKIARTILQVANEHDFSASKTSVYLGPALTNHREIESDCTSSVSPSFRAVSAAASQELNTKGQTPKDMPSALSTTLEADSIKVDFIQSGDFPILNRLGMTFPPPKTGSAAMAGVLDRDLGSDPDVYLSDDDDELQIANIPENATVFRLATREGAVPKSMEDIRPLLETGVNALRRGETVVIHCRGGIGRPGLAAACLAIAATDFQVSAADAIELVLRTQPGAIENDEQKDFIARFEEEWVGSRIDTGDHYMLYWQERSVEAHASNDMPLDVIASNQLMRVKPGDTVWIVSLTSERELILAGRMVVGEIFEYEEAIRRMPDAGLWQAEFYAFPEPGTEEYLNPSNIHDRAEEIRFDSENDRLVLGDGKINPQQLQSMRKLTRETADLFEQLLEANEGIHLDDMDPAEVLERVLEWVQNEPDEAHAHYNLGVALCRNEMDEEAIEAFKKTLELDPDYFPAQYNLGNTLIRLGRLEEAIEALNRTILIDGEYAPAHFMLGVAYYKAGRYEDAVAATRQGLQVDPADEGGYYNIAYWTYQQSDYRRAIGFCDDVIVRFPFFTSPHVLKGTCFRELGELDNEIQAYRSAADIKVDDEGAFIFNFTAVFFLGAAWERKITGSNEGIQYIEADDHFDLQDPVHQFYFAMGHLAQGEREYADKFIEDLRTSAPDLARRLERAMPSSQAVPVGSDSALVMEEAEADADTESSLRKERTAVRFELGNKIFTAKSIPDLYKQVLQYLVLTHKIHELELPFATGPKRYLIAREPIHPSGQKFMAPVEYEGYFMEAHNNRAAAITNLEKLTDAIGNWTTDESDQGSLRDVQPEPVVFDFGSENRETPLVLTPEEEGKLAKFKGCLLAGAVGDALGAAIEFDSLYRIRERFGDAGLTDYAVAYGRFGAITDDTQMTLFTAEGLIRAYMRFSGKGICHPPSVVHKAYLRWLHSQRIQVPKDDHELPDYLIGSWLLDLPELNVRRAPGKTCLAALQSGVMGTVEKPVNNSKGCGGVMRVAPAGLLTDQPFQFGADAAAITHGHPSGYISAGILAVIISRLVQGTSLPDAVNYAVYEILRGVDNHQETFYALDKAIRLAQDNTKTPSPELVETLGGGWVAEEALAISIYCSLVREDDLSSALLLAVNHSGDSDSTGAITGNILGALHGVDAIPLHWLEQLELRKEIEQVAEDLHAAALDVDLSDRYPGW